MNKLLLLFTSLITVSLAGLAVPAESSARPSILFAIADDMSWPHAGAYGDKVVKTPTFNRVAAEGVLFNNAFCASPSCTPSRGAILTGRPIHLLEEGGNLWSILPSKFKVYPDILEEAGYAVGFTRKGWGPGTLQGSGRTRNPAGPEFKNFAAFLESVPADKPFCFWFGSHDPHRPYEKGAGLKSGMKLEKAIVPSFLPDTPEVRSDILDYYYEIERFDRETGELLKQLEAAGRLENTIVVMTSDNGMPFPRAKTNLHDSGTHMPLAIRWGAAIKGGKTIDEFISFADYAPTFLEAAGLKPLPEMMGRSFLALMTGKERARERDAVFLERERHANVRKGDLGYPARAVRTRDFLYIRNFRPDRWPGGDPERYKSVGAYGDCDNSPTKELILQRRNDPEIARFFQLAFEKRPAEQLYDLKRDPGQIHNVAGLPEYRSAQRKLWARLQQWMVRTADPRATIDDDRWDRYPYFGPNTDMPVSQPQQ